MREVDPRLRQVARGEVRELFNDYLVMVVWMCKQCEQLRRKSRDERAGDLQLYVLVNSDNWGGSLGQFLHAVNHCSIEAIPDSGTVRVKLELGKIKPSPFPPALPSNLLTASLKTSPGSLVTIPGPAQ